LAAGRAIGTLIRPFVFEMSMSGDDAAAALLSRTELFGGLARADLDACAAGLREQHFAKGETLFVRGDPGSSLFLVAEGRVRLAIATEEGRELSFRHAVAGDLFGEIAALDGGVRTADATALTLVRAYSLERNVLHQLAAERPGVSAGLVGFLCRRLRETSDQLEAIALYPMHIRLARFLIVALGDRQPPPGRRLPLELGFSQSELALLLGASRPKVNEALGLLETAGAIRRTSDRLFCDPAKLAEIAQQDNA
jgi:CRP-like cAMP-binding protein